jgi:hypothetical protein
VSGCDVAEISKSAIGRNSEGYCAKQPRYSRFGETDSKRGAVRLAIANYGRLPGNEKALFQARRYGVTFRMR